MSEPSTILSAPQTLGDVFRELWEAFPIILAGRTTVIVVTIVALIIFFGALRIHAIMCDMPLTEQVRDVKESKNVAMAIRMCGLYISLAILISSIMRIGS